MAADDYDALLAEHELLPCRTPAQVRKHADRLAAAVRALREERNETTTEWTKVVGRSNDGVLRALRAEAERDRLAAALREIAPMVGTDWLAASIARHALAGNTEMEGT